MAENKKTVVTSADPNAKGKVLPPSEVKAAKSIEGDPLPHNLKQKLENRLGSDLSGYRVYSGEHSLRILTAVGAKAMTVDRTILVSPEHAFGSPENLEQTLNSELEAHELVHQTMHSDSTEKPGTEEGKIVENEAAKAIERILSKRTDKESTNLLRQHLERNRNG